VKEFSPIQTQAFEMLYHTDNHVFLGVPCGGSEKRILAELAVFREIQKENFGKIVFMTPKKERCRSVHESWKLRLGEEGMGLCVELLLNDDPE
jgi:replicative superfamily II helicase